MVTVFRRKNVLNDTLAVIILLFFCFCWSVKAEAQALPAGLSADLEAVIARSEALRHRTQPDSAYVVLAPMLRVLDSLGYGDLPAYRRLELEQSINQAKRGEYLLSLQATNTVADASCAREEWLTCAAAQLHLGDLNLSVGDKEKSRKHLRRASALIRRQQLTGLRAQELYQRANWQANFGYRDSAQHFLDSFLLLSDAPLRWQASAYDMYARYADDRLEVQDSMYRKTAGVYLKLGSYRDLARVLTSLALLYQRAGIHHEVLSLLN